MKSVHSQTFQNHLYIGNYPFNTSRCITSLHVLLQINEQDRFTRSNQAEDLCTPSPPYIYIPPTLCQNELLWTP